MSTTPADRAVAAFINAFGAAPTGLARAPGRVNLIGEHTDYNDGFVLPCAIDFETVVAFGPGGRDALIDVIAADYANAADQFDPALPIRPVMPAGDWRNYVRGMAHMLSDHAPIRPVQMAIAGNVPLGSGLSSSAALEIASGLALLAGAGDGRAPSLAPRALAKAAQAAEHHFANCQCGIMDQLISVMGEAGHAMLIDCRSLAVQPVAIAADVAIMIVHSGVQHSNSDGAYNRRRAQCESVARHFGVAALRDVTSEMLDAAQSALPDEAFRCARHVISENARTLAAAQALADGDLKRMGQLMAQSHESMRHDFEITTPEIDALVAIAADAIGAEGGARMTGGGFGGCIVALMPAARVDQTRAAITEAYRTPGGDPPAIYVTGAAQGARTVPLGAG